MREAWSVCAVAPLDLVIELTWSMASSLYKAVQEKTGKLESDHGSLDAAIQAEVQRACQAMQELIDA